VSEANIDDEDEDENEFNRRFFERANEKN